MVQLARTPAAFRSAVEAYDFGLAAPPDVPSRHALLIGNAHGLRAAREPAVLYAIAAALGARAIAFEWSHDELGSILDAFERSGTFDLDALWALPLDAEAFCGDGRFTAGHVALLERLHREGTLEQLIAFDRLDPAPAPPPEQRTRKMAARLAAEWSRPLPLLAVVGAAHAAPMGAALGLEPAMFDYGRGHELPPATVRFSVPEGEIAVVPGR